ncbi:MAG: hypothetical protein EOP09_12685, partial [Proteobacteria bacterium]
MKRYLIANLCALSVALFTGVSNSQASVDFVPRAEDRLAPGIKDSKGEILTGFCVHYAGSQCDEIQLVHLQEIKRDQSHYVLNRLDTETSAHSSYDYTEGSSYYHFRALGTPVSIGFMMAQLDLVPAAVENLGIKEVAHRLKRKSTEKFTTYLIAGLVGGPGAGAFTSYGIQSLIGNSPITARSVFIPAAITAGGALTYGAVRTSLIHHK